MGYLGEEEMVNNVTICDMMSQIIYSEAVSSVDCLGLPFDVRPCTVLVGFDFFIFVLKESNTCQPHREEQTKYVYLETTVNNSMMITKERNSI